MVEVASVIKVFLAGPSDVVLEKKAARDTMQYWNETSASASGAYLHPVAWETHAVPEVGDHPQNIINKQLLSDCDILVGIFWTRLGTPTEKSASGSVQEIEEFAESGKPVLLYFSNKPVEPLSIDQEQFKALVDFRESFKKRGLYFGYDDTQHLKDLLLRHIGPKVTEILKQGAVTQGATVSMPPVRDTVFRSRLGGEEAVAIEELRQALSRFESGWVSERDSGPVNIEDAKVILEQLFQELVSIKARYSWSLSKGQTITELELVLKEIKSLQKHMLFMDGGLSWKIFWDSGDHVLSHLRGLIESIQTPKS